RPLRQQVQRIQARTTTSISLVGADGGNNSLQFDPFLVQLVRVVDSSNNEYCLEAITPTTNVSRLSAAQFRDDGQPATALGELLRSKVFAGDLFKRYLEAAEAAIERQYRENRRRIYLVGVAKHSKVLSRYRLAMAIEGVMTTDYPAYVEVPREIEEKAYVWSEYARGDDRELENAEINKFVGGKMFLVKFGKGSRDPVWPIDVFLPQKDEAQAILGYLLADAIDGFPVPLYPRCLQKAHENAALVDFDFDILQDDIFSGVRDVLGQDAPLLDAFRLQDADPSQRRYE